MVEGPDLSAEELDQLERGVSRDWIQRTHRRSYEAWELAHLLEKEAIKTGEWWKEQWRWKEGTDRTIADLEKDVENMKTMQAVTGAEMKAELRWSSFFGSILGGAVVVVVGGLVLWMMKGGPQ